MLVQNTYSFVSCVKEKNSWNYLYKRLFVRRIKFAFSALRKRNFPSRQNFEQTLSNSSSKLFAVFLWERETFLETSSHYTIALIRVLYLYFNFDFEFYTPLFSFTHNMKLIGSNLISHCRLWIIKFMYEALWLLILNWRVLVLFHTYLAESRGETDVCPAMACGGFDRESDGVKLCESERSICASIRHV